ncbi:restriction endonuclease subunit S [Aquipseudomonas alcaligenes]|uniref:restriction endonuclease subunit S n=4 Tax=Pseudomonadaceae TaxID=135621 RepID=UPI0024316F3C|nr:restriction endonuclease subunit S [Pseudomonas alcaligenes]ELM0220180.1 restriction endonuclease subunit S [Pseudomonas aeruginosa]ELQ3400064.1 restriction endonuclease subunit S [Pseudomonas aeruginosa]
MIKATLEDVCSIKSGGTPSRGTDSYWVGSIPWAKISDLEASGDGYISDTEEHISEEGLEAIRGRIFDDGTLLFAMYGSVGKAAIVRGSVSTNQAILGIKPDASRLDLSYLKFWLRSQQHKFDQDAQGVAQKNLSAGYVRSLEIPLPPLPEQKRIAAILDKADGIRRKRQQAIQLADDFLRAVFLDMFGDPVTNPKGWETKALKDISRIQIGPFGTQLHKEDYIEGGIPLVNPTHIVKGQIAPKNDLTISAQKHAELPEYHLKVGDIIMGRRGEMGRCAVVTEKENGWLCGTGSLFVRPNKAGIFSEYLNKFLSSDAIKSHLESESLGSTMPNLNKTIVGSIKVPVPSELVLEQFAKIKEKALGAKAMYSKFCDELIFEAISQKAFSGQL